MQAKAVSPIFRLTEELLGMIVRLRVARPAGRAGDEEWFGAAARGGTKPRLGGGCWRGLVWRRRRDRLVQG